MGYGKAKLGEELLEPGRARPGADGRAPPTTDPTRLDSTRLGSALVHTAPNPLRRIDAEQGQGAWSKRELALQPIDPQVSNTQRLAFWALIHFLSIFQLTGGQCVRLKQRICVSWFGVCTSFTLQTSPIADSVRAAFVF